MEFDILAQLPDYIDLAKQAGRAIMSFHHTSSEQLQVSRKRDHTLLTKADIVAHEILCQGLSHLTPAIPILSEEGEIPDFSIRKGWHTYWLLDPLDGTRGFVHGLDEFTVNIALIQNGKPILGIIYAPVFDICYFATKNQGAWKQESLSTAQRIHTKKLDPQQLSMLLGRFLSLDSHLLKIAQQIPHCTIIQLNSSLKFAWIAEGLGDFYPRFGQTGEWDTAAGQCILEEAGGCIVNLSVQNIQLLQYNQQASLINPAFLAVGDPSELKSLIGIISTLNS